MARKRKSANKRGSFYDLMTEEVPKDVALSSRGNQKVEEYEEEEETKPVRGRVKGKEKKKSGILGLFGGRSRTELEDDISDYGDVSDEVTKYISTEEKDKILDLTKGITSPVEIIDLAEREGLEIQNLIYMNIINTNDYQSYLEYIKGAEAQMARKRQAEELAKKREQEEEEKEKVRQQQELARKKALELKKQKAIEDEQNELLALKNRIGKKSRTPESVEKVRQEIQESNVGEEIKEKLSSANEGREDKSEPDISSVLDNFLGGGNSKEVVQVETSVEDNFTDSFNIDYNYNEEIADSYDNVYTEEEKVKETHQEEENALEPAAVKVTEEEEEEVEEVEEPKMDIYIVGNLYKILKNSGVGGKTPTGYEITKEDENEHFDNNLNNYNIILIETEEGINDYLFSRNNLLVITQDVPENVKNRLAGFLKGTGEEGGSYHRIVTIKGGDTEVRHPSVEEGVLLTKESLDRYYSTHDIDNYYSVKQGFNSLDSFLDM